MLAMLPCWNLDPNNRSYEALAPALYSKKLQGKRLGWWEGSRYRKARDQVDLLFPASTFQIAECKRPRFLKTALDMARQLLKDGTLEIKLFSRFEKALIEYVDLKLECSEGSQSGFVINGKAIAADLGAFISRSDQFADIMSQETLELLKAMWLRELRERVPKLCPGITWSSTNKRDAQGRNQRGYVGVKWKLGCEPEQ